MDWGWTNGSLVVFDTRNVRSGDMDPALMQCNLHIYICVCVCAREKVWFLVMCLCIYKYVTDAHIYLYIISATAYVRPNIFSLFYFLHDLSLYTFWWLYNTFWISSYIYINIYIPIHNIHIYMYGMCSVSPHIFFSFLLLRVMFKWGIGGGGEYD